MAMDLFGVEVAPNRGVSWQDVARIRLVNSVDVSNEETGHNVHLDE
jgi:hypothetical protein